MAKTAKEQLGVDLPENEDPASVAPEVTQEEPSRPEWLPEKFKDEGEFAASYKALENELRERGESQKALESRISQLTTVVENLNVGTREQPQGTDLVKEQLLAAFESDPVGTMAYLAQQYATQTVDEKLSALQTQNSPQMQREQEARNQLLAMAVDEQLGRRHDDWDEYKGKVAQAIEADPSLFPEEALLVPERAASVLDRVYKTIKYEEMEEQLKNGTFQPQDNTRAKQMAQTMSGHGVRQGAADLVDEKMARLQAAVKGSSYTAFRNG